MHGWVKHMALMIEHMSLSLICMHGSLFKFYFIGINSQLVVYCRCLTSGCSNVISYSCI